MQRRHRHGFTITELLVAMALIVFIMYILAEAFSAGSTAFRNLKAIGDMNEKLRTTSTSLRKLLQADHFDGRRRLSDPDFWKDGPPPEGFLRIYHGSAASNVVGSPYFSEGIDDVNNPSYRASDHALHFSTKLRGNNRGDVFRASIPGSQLLLLPLQDTRFQEAGSGTVCSSWAEVAVFLRDSGDLSEDVENAALTKQKLYTLHLRQRLCLPDNDLVTPKIPVGQYPIHAEMSCHQDPLNAASLYFNSPADLTMPARRFGSGSVAVNTLSGNMAFQPLGTDNASYEGNDVLLTNVLSFEVRVLLDRNQWNAYYAANPPAQPHDFVGLHHPAINQFTAGTNNTAFGPARVFDTWTRSKDDAYDYSNFIGDADPTKRIPLYSNQANGQGARIRLIALQITIRIWDVNTKQTRQTSIVVDL